VSVLETLCSLVSFKQTIGKVGNPSNPKYYCHVCQVMLLEEPMTLSRELQQPHECDYFEYLSLKICNIHKYLFGPWNSTSPRTTWWKSIVAFYFPDPTQDTFFSQLWPYFPLYICPLLLYHNKKRVYFAHYIYRQFLSILAKTIIAVCDTTDHTTNNL
jgi:hypothetical protein